MLDSQRCTPASALRTRDQSRSVFCSRWLHLITTAYLTAFCHDTLQFYPDVCLKVVGEQKEVAVDTETEAPAAPSLAAPAVQEEADEEELELDVKEEEVNVAIAKSPAGGKVRLDLFWRAFWCVVCGGCKLDDTFERSLMDLLLGLHFAAPDAWRLSPSPCSNSFATKSAIAVVP